MTGPTIHNMPARCCRCRRKVVLVWTAGPDGARRPIWHDWETGEPHHCEAAA